MKGGSPATGKDYLLILKIPIGIKTGLNFNLAGIR